MNYLEAGVNVEMGNELVKQLGPLLRGTFDKNVIDNFGSYSALYDISKVPVKNPVLSLSVDGVGSKINLAIKYNKLDGLGQDLVAMVMNDIICCGAQPLMFLDYYAANHLSLENSLRVIKGVVTACETINVSFIGGETAEMPLTYNKNDFDLAGLGVGIVDKEKIINPDLLTVGDVIIGLGSSGPHSNGFALINELDANNFNLTVEERRILIHESLVPTRLYVNTILKLIEHIDVKGIAHITGGGLTENLPRIFPDHLSPYLDMSWPTPEIFNIIRRHSTMTSEDMLRTYNMGVGMVVIVSPDELLETLDCLHDCNETVYVIGTVIKNTNYSGVVYGKGVMS